MVAKAVYQHSKTLGLHKTEGRTPDNNGAYYQAALEFHISPDIAQSCFKEFGKGEPFRLDEEIRREAEKDT